MLVWSFYSIPLRMELSGYFFPAKWSGHCIPAGIGWSLHACRNGVVISFPQEWNGVIPFLQEWNDHFIPAGMDGVSFPRWDIPREPGSQAPTKSSGSHEMLAEMHMFLSQI